MVSLGAKGGELAETKNKWRRIEHGLYELPRDKEGKRRFAAEWVFEGRKIRKRFRTVTQAREVLYAVRGQIVEGRYLDRRREVKTYLKDAVDKFLEWGHGNLAARTQAHDALFTKRWLSSPHFQGRTLNEIGPAQVEAYRLEEKVHHGIRQADYSLARLRRMFNLCITWELCEKNPIGGGKVKFFNPKGRRDRYLSVEEEKHLLGCAPPRLQAAIVFSIHTGVRQGELLSITWDDFSPKVGRFGSIKVKGEVAKDREDRHIPLSARAREVLGSIPRALRGEDRIFGFLGSGRENLNKMWYKALRASKLNQGVPAAQRITWHTLRHTFASRLVMARVDLATVQRLMGHSSITTTMRYAHLAPRHLEDAVLTLDEFGKHSVNIAEKGDGEPRP